MSFKVGCIPWNSGLTVKTDSRVCKNESNRRLSRVYERLPRIIIKCKECNREFFDLVSSDRIFCSKRCTTTWQHKNNQDKMFEWRKDKNKVEQHGKKISLAQKGVPEKDWVKKQLSESIKQLYVDRPELRFEAGKPWRGKKRPEHSEYMRFRGFASNGFRPRFTSWLKKEIKEEFNGECFLCLEQLDVLPIHHINMIPKDNSKNNLIPLCRSCHSILHWNSEVISWET